MADDFKYDVFLSHSSKDTDVARDIAERLRADGLEVWFEGWELKPEITKANRVRRIEEGLEHSRVLVLFVSANAFGSELEQLESGVSRFYDPTNKDRRLIHLQLDAAPIKKSLVREEYIKWIPRTREQEYVKLLEACRSVARSTEEEASMVREQAAERVTQLAINERIRAYVFSPDGNRVLSGCDDYTVRLWNAETGDCLGVFKGHKSVVLSVSWSNDQCQMLSGAGNNDQIARLWDVEANSCLLKLQGHKYNVLCVALSADQRYALSGSDDDTVRLWDLATGKCSQVLRGHRSGVYSVAWSTDQRFALTGSLDNSVQLWDLMTGCSLCVLQGHTGCVNSVAWSADQKHALSGSNDKTVRLWDLEKERCLLVFEGHRGGVLSVAWNDDGRLALSGSADKTMRLWDVETGRCLSEFEGHASGVVSVAWSADYRRAYSGDYGGGIRVWDLAKFVVELRTSGALRPNLPPGFEQVQYTNAKVLLVGESGAGKTGLTERLAHGTFTPSYSTSGTWSTQWPMENIPIESSWEQRSGCGISAGRRTSD